jgi:hypothetical protein
MTVTFFSDSPLDVERRKHTCLACGAVGYGNITCYDCVRQWPRFGVAQDDLYKRLLEDLKARTGTTVRDKMNSSRGGSDRARPRSESASAGPVILPRLPEGVVILALDLGSISGFAAAVAGQEPLWGHEDFRKGDPSSGELFARLGRWVDALILMFGPGLVSFESPYVPPFGKRDVRLANGEAVNLPGLTGGAKVKGIPFNNATTRRLYGLAAVAEEHCAAAGVPVCEVSTGKVCQFFTSRGSWGGRDKKKAATMRVCHAYGFAAATYDESDAIAVAMYLEALIWPRISQGRGVGPLFMAAPRREVVDTRGR